MILDLVPVRPSSGRRQRADAVLAVAVAGLAAIGLAAVSIATTGRLEPTAPHVVRQAAALALGAGIATALAAVDYRRIALLAPVLYVVALVLLGLVLVAGTSVNGAQAWLLAGPVQFQPSELAKVALLLMLAVLTQ